MSFLGKREVFDQAAQRHRGWSKRLVHGGRVQPAALPLHDGAHAVQAGQHRSGFVQREGERHGFAVLLGRCHGSQM
jgi:hypothetical protein